MKIVKPHDCRIMLVGIAAYVEGLYAGWELVSRLPITAAD
jgi:hypothetical protein